MRRVDASQKTKNKSLEKLLLLPSKTGDFRDYLIFFRIVEALRHVVLGRPAINSWPQRNCRG